MQGHTLATLQLKGEWMDLFPPFSIGHLESVPPIVSSQNFGLQDTGILMQKLDFAYSVSLKRDPKKAFLFLDKTFAIRLGCIQVISKCMGLCVVF